MNDFVLRLLVVIAWVSFIFTAGAVLKGNPKARGERISAARWWLFVTTLLLTAAFLAALFTPR